MSKLYLLYCEICGYKRITDGSDAKDLVEVKTSPLFTTAPKIDPITKKHLKFKPKKRRKRFKCPKCGRVVFPKRIDNLEKNNEDYPPEYQAGDER
jgi:predicted RNA-binding Zn-ribbon protein involved in translation (DUF1610 family)